MSTIATDSAHAFRRSRPAIVVSLVAAVTLATAAPAEATHTAYWPTTIHSQYRSAGSYYGAFFMYIELSWNSTNAANMRAEATQGRRYTQDQRDRDLNVTASGPRYSNFPNPVYDTDDDNGDEKLEESEVTADSTSFPSAGTHYWFRQQWDHRFWSNAEQQYFWDPNSGYVRHHAQISYRPCFIICFEWDTWEGHSVKVGNDQFYPYVAQQSAALTLDQVEDAGTTALPADAPDDPDYEVVPLDVDTVLLVPHKGQSLDAYRNAALGRAQSITGLGPGRGVITFTKPLSDGDLSQFVAAGLVFLDVEAIGNDAVGDRLSAAAPYSKDVVALLQAAAPAGARIEGVVAANVEVDARALTTIRTDPRIFAVDLSIEDYRRRSPSSVDVLMNDVYWKLAGWE